MRAVARHGSFYPAGLRRARISPPCTSAPRAPCARGLRRSAIRPFQCDNVFSGWAEQPSPPHLSSHQEYEELVLSDLLTSVLSWNSSAPSHNCVPPRFFSPPLSLSPSPSSPPPPPATLARQLLTAPTCPRRSHLAVFFILLVRRFASLALVVNLSS